MADTQSRDDDDDMVVEGSMGSVSRVAVEASMMGQLDALQRCYVEALGTAPFLLGDVVLSFRLNGSGNVRWVHVVSSTLGHQAAERCLAERAARIRFPRPQGGEAEFSYPLAFQPGSARPPEIWSAERISSELSRHRDELSACGLRGDGFSLTLYVNRGGRVASAGCSYPRHDEREVADCIARAALRMAMPDPGSWIAKVTVDL